MTPPCFSLPHELPRRGPAGATRPRGRRPAPRLMPSCSWRGRTRAAPRGHRPDLPVSRPRRLFLPDGPRMPRRRRRLRSAVRPRFRLGLLRAGCDRERTDLGGPHPASGHAARVVQIVAQRAHRPRPRLPQPRCQPGRLLASACLPQFFKAVEIEGEPFWDGGYLGNPALWPLYEQGGVPT